MRLLSRSIIPTLRRARHFALPGFGSFVTTKVYLGVGADIVMESFCSQCSEGCPGGHRTSLRSQHWQTSLFSSK